MSPKPGKCKHFCYVLETGEMLKVFFGHPETRDMLNFFLVDLLETGEMLKVILGIRSKPGKC